MTTLDVEQHADDCDPDENGECHPNFRGDWNQPPGVYVEQAKAELDDDAPWCRIHHLAHDFMEAEESGGDTP